MDIVSRLREVVRFYQFSDRAFAIKCGLKQPTFDKQIKGLRAVSLETVVSVACAFPEVSRDWLLVGDGSMLKTPDTKNMERMDSLIDTIATLQQALNEKSKTIELLQERINQLEK